MLNPNINHNRFEAISKIFNLKEMETQKGWMYRFTFSLSGSDEENNPLTEYMQALIFTKERIVGLEDKAMAHFIGELRVKPAYGSFPQTTQVIGYFIQPVFGNAYKITNPKTSKPPHSKSEEQKGE